MANNSPIDLPAGRPGFRPSHPGRILRRDLDALEMTVETFAAHIGVSRQTAHNVISGRHGVTPEMAARLARAFKTSTGFWLNLQSAHDAWEAERLESVMNIKPIRRGAGKLASAARKAG